MSGLSFNICTPTPVSGCISFTTTGTYGSVCNTSTIPQYTNSMISQGIKDFTYMSNNCK